MCRVVNKYKEEYDVYIGRGSKWGNPFVIGKDGDRDEVIRKYRAYLWEQIKEGNITYKELINLNGKVLGCYCKPKACHGDVIRSAVEYCMKYYCVGEVCEQFFDEFGRIRGNINDDREGYISIVIHEH